MSFKEWIIVLDNNSVWGAIIFSNVSSIEGAPAKENKTSVHFHFAGRRPVGQVTSPDGTPRVQKISILLF